MVERRPGLTFVSHLILALGVIIIAFPLYLTFVASTQTAEQITQSIPMSLTHSISCCIISNSIGEV